MTDTLFKPIDMSVFSTMRRVGVPSKNDSGTRSSSSEPNRKMDKFVFKVKAVVIVSITLCVLSLTVSLISLFGTEGVYNPLGPYPTQKVLSRVEGVLGPAVLVNDPLSVKGEKCTEETTTITGSLTWVMEVPKKIIINAGSGQGTMEAGCKIFDFENPMPNEVVNEVERQARMGFPYTKWVVSGTETPIDPEGDRGQPIVWTTEEFQIISNQG